MPIRWESKSYSREDFKKAWGSSSSIAEVLYKLGYAQGGGSYDTIRRAAEELELDYVHMKGQGHMKGKRANNLRPLSELLVKGSKAGRLKERLFREGVFERRCSICLITEWNEKPAPLELDHIDGDNTNNEIQNLRILCPNCHAQTETYKGKNIARREKQPALCIDCSKEISNKGAKRCKSCSRSAYSKIIWPSIDDLKLRVSERGYSQVGRDLGVSDNAVRKHIKSSL